MLLIDIGNSRIKWASWQNNQITDYTAMVYCENELQAWLKKNMENVDKQKVFVCSVAGHTINQIIISWFKQHWQTNVQLIETASTQYGVTNAYNKTTDLGVDRWLAIVAAYQRHKKAVCVIDCGTAVTLDVVDGSGQHLGGLIMPGLYMMQQALLNGAQRIDSLQGKALPLANNTEDAVVSGCTHLLVSGLDDLYRKYNQQLNVELMCVLTGGDGKNVAKRMESNCHYEEDLILYGLHLAAQLRD